MVIADDFWKLLSDNGYSFFSGVPCSILEPVLKSLGGHPEIKYVPAVRENCALGVSCGAYLAGKKSGILMQNSGLGNVINALTSFNLIYKIPVLMFITWRGYQGKDAPEHIIMGKKMLKILKSLDIPTVILTDNYRVELKKAFITLKETNLPVAVILRKGLIVEKD
jgi:phosphonopyruvate decarboxylase